MDLKNFSAKQLDELVVAAGLRKAEIVQESKASARTRIEKILTDEGLALDELFGKRRGNVPMAKRAKSAPKYSNPKDRAQTWTGRGRKPLWVVDALKSGKKIEDLAIVWPFPPVKPKKPGNGPAKKAIAKPSATRANGKVSAKRPAKKA